MIRSVNATLLEATADEGVKFGQGQFNTFQMVLVEVLDDAGHVGYGEALVRRSGEMTVAAVRSLLEPVLLGQDPWNIEGLWTRMVDQLRGWGHTAGIVMEAVSGIDTALWDLVSKQADRPIWQMLTGAGRNEVNCYASSVYIGAIDDMVAEAVKQQERGFERLKIKIGRRATDGGQNADLTALREIRKAVGDRFELVVDANGVYTAADAIRMGRAMEALDIRWFEEPVPMDDLSGYERIHWMTSVPLARGETDFGVFTIGDVINRRLIDIVQPDIGRCGGITGARHMWTLAYSHNIGFAPHTGFSGGISQIAALHVAAAAPNTSTLEYMFIDNPLRELFVGGYPRPHAGRVPVPNGQGIGLKVDGGLVERYTKLSTKHSTALA